jgi:protein SCO1/2
MFRTRCAACHTLGGGNGVGPDLLGVTSARGRDWLTKYILAPDKMLEEKDPVAVALFKKYNKVKMPNLHLAPVDVKTLLDYFESKTAAAAQRNESSDKTESESTKTSQGPARN